MCVSIDYEDPGPMWLCNVVIISECLEEHTAYYQKLKATGYSKTFVITCNTRLLSFRTIKEFLIFLKLMLPQDV